MTESPYASAVRSIGIIGYGSFGQFVHELARRYAPDIDVHIYSTGGEHESAESLDLVAKSDLMVLCVPIRAYASVLEEVVPRLGPASTIIDVATVKEYTVGLIKKYKDVRYVATHPMFGPYSFLKRGKTLEGLRLVLTDHTLAQEELTSFRNITNELGLVILEMSPEAHDRMLAETLFLTHYIGQVVTKGGFRRTDIDTVSFGFLMDAVESVQNDMELFQDVYTHNRHCADVIARFEDAEREVRAYIDVK